MAGRNVYELTPREREVFAFLRLGLTNAEIGERLGITEAGAKYHVAQILSKLGVSSREEAALALEARPWWARALATGVAARAAAAGVVVAALAGMGLLVWGVLETGSGSTPPDLEGLTEEQVYARVGEALRPPDGILHTRLTTSSGPVETGGTILWYTIDFWVDGAKDTFRSEFQLGPDMEWDVAAETVSITVGHYTYVQDEPERVYRKEIDETYCPGSGDAIVGTILMCGFAAFSAEIDTNTEYDGRHAVAVRHRILDDSGEGITTVYMDAVTFLPMARTIIFSPDGHEVRIIIDYEHELVDPAALPPGFLDPRSLGYGVGNEDEALDEIAREVPVYWLGSDAEMGDQAFCTDLLLECALVLAGVGRAVPGIASLGYETPSGVDAVYLHLWTPDAFEEFRLTDLGRLLYDAPCVSQRELELESDGRAIMFAAHRPIFGTGAYPGPIAGPLPYALPSPPPFSTPRIVPVPEAELAPLLTPPPPEPEPPPGELPPLPTPDIDQPIVETPPSVPAPPPPLATPLPTLADGCPAVPPNHFPAHVFFEDAVVGVNVPQFLEHPIFFPVMDTRAAVEWVVQNLRPR